MKCKIQWIGLDGKPTPDENEAVAIANAHEPVWSHPGGSIDNHVIGYTDAIRESFPICADHLPQLRGLIGKGWSVSPLPAAPPPRFRVEVIADSSGQWVGNGRTFATYDEAKAYALDLTWRWTAVREWRVTGVPAAAEPGSAAGTEPNLPETGRES